jgi:hypothetical protein
LNASVIFNDPLETDPLASTVISAELSEVIFLSDGRSEGMILDFSVKPSISFHDSLKTVPLVSTLIQR